MKMVAIVKRVTMEVVAAAAIAVIAAMLTDEVVASYEPRMRSRQDETDSEQSQMR